MKKIFALLMVTVLTVGTCIGCGSSEASSDTKETQASAVEESTTENAEQTQTEKALALINTFATGDTDTAKELLAEDYIQHNLAMCWL